MSILPRFPPHRKLTGRDYNLICDAVEAYLPTLSQAGQTDTLTATNVSAGVSEVRAGSGVAVAPTTGDVVITYNAIAALPALGGGVAQGASSPYTAPAWTTLSLQNNALLPELVNGVNGAFTPLVNNSIWTFIMWPGAGVTLASDDSSFGLRLLKNGVELVKGTAQLVAEGARTRVGQYDYNFQLVTTTRLQIGDQIQVQIIASTATAIYHGLGFQWIRWN